MERFGQSMEYRSATPQEIRDGLGLREDASHAEVVAERLKRYEESLSTETAEGEDDA